MLDLTNLKKYLIYKMKIYKVGLFGAGNIFSKHFEIFKKNKKFSLASIYDRKIEKISKSRLYDNEKNILKKKDIDIITVLSPSGFHFKQTKKILTSKKHAIVEKPLALKIDHIKEIIQLEKKHKKKVFVVFQHRLNPAVIKLKKFLKENKLGKVFLISSKLYWCRNQSYYKNNWRGSWKQDGGVVTNQGIHNIDLITTIFGGFQKLFARSNTISKLIETEDVCVVSGILKNNIICNMEFTTAARPENLENSIIVLGDKGYFKISGKNLDQYSNNFEKKLKKINIKNLHKEFYENLYQTLSKKTKNNFSASSSMKSLETIVAIYQSLKCKREIKFPLKKLKIKLGS